MAKPDFLAVETEIQQEKAETLGKAGERLERALQELETFRRDLDDVDRLYPVPPPLTLPTVTHPEDGR
jgi:hypothetical protein